MGYLFMSDIRLQTNEPVQGTARPLTFSNARAPRRPFTKFIGTSGERNQGTNSLFLVLLQSAHQQTHNRKKLFRSIPTSDYDYTEKGTFCTRNPPSSTKLLWTGIAERTNKPWRPDKSLVDNNLRPEMT